LWAWRSTSSRRPSWPDSGAGPDRRDAAVRRGPKSCASGWACAVSLRVHREPVSRGRRAEHVLRDVPGRASVLRAPSAACRRHSAVAPLPSARHRQAPCRTGRFTFESLGTALTGKRDRPHRADCALLLSAIVLARLLGPAGLGVVAIARPRCALRPSRWRKARRSSANGNSRARSERRTRAQAIAALRFGLIAALAWGCGGGRRLGLLLPVDRSRPRDRASFPPRWAFYA
jgi:hypothetical protein